MFKRMVLKRVLDEVGELQNAMKKRIHFRDIAELAMWCLDDHMRSLFLIGFFVGSVAFGEVLSLSFEDRYIGNTGVPGGSNTSYNAGLFGTPYFNLIYKYSGETLSLGSNGSVSLHQPNDDLDQRISFAYTLYLFGTGADWVVSTPVKQFSSWFQYFSYRGDGIFNLTFLDSSASPNWEVIGTQQINLNGVINDWYTFNFTSSRSFDRVRFEIDEDIVFDNVSFNTVPEPSALSLLAIGLGGLALVRRRRS